MTPEGAVSVKRTRLRRALRLLGSGLVITLITLLLAEGLLRALNPPPRVLVIRSKDWGGRMSPSGVPLWSVAEDRIREPCAQRAPGATLIAFFGTSITDGVDVPIAETFPALLETRLKPRFPRGLCIDNLAVPGFGFEQELAAAREYLAKQHPALVFAEVWDGDKHLTRLGDALYELKDFATDTAGYPALPLLPATAMHALFRRSRLVEFGALAFGAKRAGDPQRHSPFCDELLPAFVSLLGDAHVPFGLFVAPPLSRPFEQSLPPTDWNVYANCAQTLKLPTFLLAEDLRGQDFQKVRLDDCCHYNAVGHELLAKKFEQHVLQLLPEGAR